MSGASNAIGGFRITECGGARIFIRCRRSNRMSFTARLRNDGTPGSMRDTESVTFVERMFGKFLSGGYVQNHPWMPGSSCRITSTLSWPR